MKNRFFYILICFISLLLFYCKKETLLPYINTNGITEITTKTATSGGVITAETISDKGICWGADPQPDIEGNKISAGSGTERFSVKIIGLKSNTLYYARAYAANNAGVVYGESVQFRTLLGPPPPTINTTALEVLVSNSVQIAASFQNTSQIKLLSYGVCWSEQKFPTVDNNKATSVLSSYNSFTTNLNGLDKGKKYYATAYVTSEDDVYYGSECTFNTYADLITDVDGNQYHTVKIGNQEWTVENLKTTRFRDGSSIPMVLGDNSWQQANVSAYCYYNDEIGNALEFGVLYNWYAVSDSKKLAPTGWHIPSPQEFQTLITYLGGEIPAGQKIRSTEPGYWPVTTYTNSNESGFTALPAGRRNTYSSQLGSESFFWTNLQGSYYFLNYYGLSQNYGSNYFGFSVRCIKD